MNVPAGVPVGVQLIVGGGVAAGILGAGPAERIALVGIPASQDGLTGANNSSGWRCAAHEQVVKHKLVADQPIHGDTRSGADGFEAVGGSDRSCRVDSGKVGGGGHDASFEQRPRM